MAEFQQTEPRMTSSGAEFIPPTIEKLIADLGPLPPTAQILARLQALLSDTNSDLNDISALLRLDAAMTTRLIKISNSTWFNRGQPCHTLDEAVNRIGFREVFQVVSIAASSSLVAQPQAAYGKGAISIWRESVACALAGELLADKLGDDTAVAFMNGLLHAIGRQALNRHAAAAGRAFTDGGFPLDYSGAEFALYGFTQAEVGAQMLDKWKFAAENVEPVRRQYEPQETPDPFDRQAVILYCARLLGLTACNGQEVAVPETEEEILSILRLSRGDVLAMRERLEGKLKRAEQIVRI